jgi:hypothetical protein
MLLCNTKRIGFNWKHLERCYCLVYLILLNHYRETYHHTGMYLQRKEVQV